MRGVTIGDTDGRGLLAFDLRDVLDVLEEEALESRWRVEHVECVGASADELLKRTSPGGFVHGAELLAWARRVVQVIDGKFSGYRVEEAVDPWIVVRAVDSSAFDVETEDLEVLERLRHRFSRVSELPT